MKKAVLVFAAAMMALCAAGALAHAKKKAAPAGPAIESGSEEAKRSGVTADAAIENHAAHDAGVAEEKEGMELVLWLGVLTALSLLSTVFFPVFRIPAAGWMTWHKRAAYLTLCCMLLHGSLALYGHFFG